MASDYTPDEIRVGIAEWRVAKGAAQITTLGLGSCVGISLYDPLVMVAGLAHIMLPDSKQFSNPANPGKFPDLVLPLLLKEMEILGGRRQRMLAKIAGGAQMFNYPGGQKGFNSVGSRNILASKEVLFLYGIPLIAEETGGNWGRTMIVDTRSGQVTIRAVGKPLLLI
ncbi:MAG: chemotaxis protein CheD [Syntrophomonadaceae bacterium]|nr:chemotaxis protein CheD [Syntrophomonadaceae bacterium]